MNTANDGKKAISGKILFIMSNLEFIRDHMISERQEAVLRFLAEAPAVSMDVAMEFNISSKNAGVQLRRLHDAGYLTRTEFPYGGAMTFLYSLADELKQVLK